MNRLRQLKSCRATHLLMSVVLLLLLGCQGMAMASVPNAGSKTGSARMENMPSCHLMELASKAPQATDGDCQHFVKAFNTSAATVLLLWVPLPTALPSWARTADDALRIAPIAYFPPHDPVVDPPPTLRLHRFLE